MFADSVIRRGEGEDEGTLARLAEASHCVRVTVTIGESVPAAEYAAALHRAVDESKRLSGLLCTATHAESAEQRSALLQQRLWPWAVALQRGALPQRRSSCLAPPPAPPSPLPAKDAALFGALVFPPALRDGYTMRHGEGAVLPHVALAFVNARGVPMFKFDEEALEVIWKLVPALGAAVAVYDDEQRLELIRLVRVWRSRPALDGGGALSAKDAETLSVGVPSRVFAVERALHNLLDAEAAQASGEDPPVETPGAKANVCESNTERQRAVHGFLQACVEHKVRRFHVHRVLSRSGVLSLRPVPPIQEVKKEKAPPPARMSDTGALSTAAFATARGSSVDEGSCVFEPSAFPESFLSFALAQMASEGIDRCEGIAFDVFQTMKRLVNRQQ